VSVKLAVSVNDPEALNITVYPNPASQYLTIETKELGSESYARIFTLSGKQVLERKVISHITRMDVSELKNGVYILKLENEKSGNSLRLLISR
jgi:predicted secreted protein